MIYRKALSLLVFAFQAQAQAQAMVLTRQEIVFVIDGSNSVGPTNFTDSYIPSIIDGAEAIVTTATAANCDIPVTFGYTLFSGTVTGSLAPTDLQSFSTALSAEAYPNSDTRLDLAFTAAGNLFTPTDPNVLRTVIVIQDGSSDFPTSTQTEAAALRSDGVDIFSVGVTRRINVSEMTSYSGAETSPTLRGVGDAEGLLADGEQRSFFVSTPSYSTVGSVLTSSADHYLGCTNPAVVPEPSASLLGLLSLGVLCRRRR